MFKTKTVTISVPEISKKGEVSISWGPRTLEELLRCFFPGTRPIYIYIGECLSVCL